MQQDTPSIQDLIKNIGADSPDAAGNISVSEKLEEKVHDVHIKEKEVETKKWADANHLPYINLKSFPLSPEALQQIPKNIVEQFNAVCFLYTGTEIRVASTNPESENVHELLFQLQERTKANGALYKMSEESLRIALEAYNTLPKIQVVQKGVSITREELDRYLPNINHFSDIQKQLSGVSISEILTVLLAAAVNFDASDIHIEAEEDGIAVRFRLDGVLQDVATLPKDEWKKIISRVKLIGGLKINITERPQDGRFTIYLQEGDSDVRLSTIPTSWGESVVMRILRPSSISVEFSSLGWRKDMEEKLLREIAKPHGMIITTGPTGSGKTTTLYAVLQKLNSSEKKIMTLEDPIEYKVKGLNQSQIDHTKDYTFVTGLRAILRQDPDIVMVGEIRDLETADTAINSALTGHLMLSTLHTNNAAGAIPRFLSMGVKPFLLGSSLNAIIAQRLVRRVHDGCKEGITLDAQTLSRIEDAIKNIPDSAGLDIPQKENWKFYQGRGCDACNHTGFKGRVGVFELLLMDKAIAEILKNTNNISEDDILDLAKKQGMLSMLQDGLIKALSGMTTPQEVFRVAME